MCTEIKKKLDEYKQYLIEEAQQVVSEYWDEHQKINERCEWGKKGLIGLRARVREKEERVYLEIVWFKMNFIKKGENKKTLMWSKTYRKGKGTTQPLHIIKKAAQDWELEMIKEAERKLQPIRNCYKLLGKMSLTYHHLKAADEKLRAELNEGEEQYNAATMS